MKELKVNFNATVREDCQDIDSLIIVMKKYLADSVAMEYPELNQVFNVSVEEVK